MTKLFINLSILIIQDRVIFSYKLDRVFEIKKALSNPNYIITN